MSVLLNIENSKNLKKKVIVIIRFAIPVVLSRLIRVELIFKSNTTCLFDGRGVFTLLPKVQLHVSAFQQ